ncbi:MULTISPECIES: hypothetical protein [Acinetobacter]|uniref:Uncharacterized protein n=1 Tax=Acinetobacter indicus TaxID=756892 RepID=A0A6C0Y6J3_9GAMM|nr:MULTISPECIES: hypothetical protein [Acinetobacter]QIC71861.1 hypothetical protein FSC09_15845 [Acinetobacter indicus]QKQ71397.1 hypothetical protein E5Y90_14295 [Acinetobacter sp. 10FS3-1]
MKQLDIAKIIAEYSKQLKRNSLETSAMPHPLIEGKLLTQADMDALHQDIEELGKQFKLNLKELPPKLVPVLTARMPNVDYKQVRIYEMTRDLDKLYVSLADKFILLDDKDVVTFSEDMSKFVVSYENASYEFKTPDDLCRHLASGKKGYLIFQFRQGFVKWVTETDGNLRMAWLAERDEYGRLSSITIDAFRLIARAKEYAVARKQQIELNELLPFKWTTATRPTRGGLSGSAKSMMNGNVANTVVHLLVQEDCKIGRLSRSAGDYLCAPSKGRLARDLGPFIEEMAYKIDEHTIHANLPKEITCKDCLEKLAAIKNKVKGK